MRAVIDACVLYPTVMRQIVLGVAQAGLMTPIWSDRLLGEWVRTAARHGGPADEALAHGDVAALGLAFPAARIMPDPALQARLWLPDSGDVHVLATAITARADKIVTLNLRDFPRAELSAHGIAAIHPDALLYALWIEQPRILGDVVAGVHARAEHLSGAVLPQRALLKRARLPRLAKALG